MALRLACWMCLSPSSNLRSLQPIKEAGRMIGAHGVLIVIGYSMAGFSGFRTYYASPTVSWRLCLSLQIVAPLLLFIGSP